VVIISATPVVVIAPPAVVVIPMPPVIIVGRRPGFSVPASPVVIPGIPRTGTRKVARDQLMQKAIVL
jgi:hypothetical protein